MDAIDINRRHWDALADVHQAGDGRFYDLEALRRGASPLWEVEQAALARVAPGGVAGVDVLHLQCHLAADAIAFARDGARVTGLDLSPNALRLAAERAAACGVEGIRWVQADASHPPAELDGAFDLAWATIGITVWAVDLQRWMAAAAAMLKPGGRLVLIDLHPLYNMAAGFDPLTFDLPYGGGEVHVLEDSGSYDDPGAAVAEARSANVAWNVGEHVAAAVAAGLVVEHLEEHLSADHDPRGMQEPEPDGRYRFRAAPGSTPLPLLFTLVARRP